ncbi:MAG TPA: hypothetical protein VFF73_34410 [Planctomycetota bacterium]|nr:hypothetical protein [Planctomycetota bacterium]
MKSLLVPALLIGSIAYADSLTYKDGRVVRGRVLAEFRDLLYVQVDADPACFIKRADLAATMGSNGESLGPSGTASPALAVDSVVGDVRLERAGAPAAAVTDLAFAEAKDRIATGDTGLARLALVSGTVAKLGPSSSVITQSATTRGDAFALERGQVFVSPVEGRAVSIALGPEVHVEVSGPVEVVREATRVAVNAHGGEARLESPAFQIHVPPSHGVHLVPTEDGLSVTAESSNSAGVELTAGRQTRILRPGESFSITGSSLASAIRGSWRFARIRGSILLRKTATGRFVEVRDGEGVHIDDGDAVTTGAGAEAVLVRDDGATASLRESSELTLGDDLAVTAGAVKIEALRAPVPLAVPGGEARLSVATFEVRRPARLGSALEVATLEGEARLGFVGATAVLPKGSKARLDGRLEEATIQATEGALRISTVAQPEAGDPEVEVALDAPHFVGVRAQHAEGISFLLEGARTVTVGPDKASARIAVGAGLPKITFANGAEWTLEQEVTLRAGSQEGTPAATFPSSARVRFPEGTAKGVIGTPAVFTFDNGTSVTCKDRVQITLRGGEGLAGAIVGMRTEDRFEIPLRNAAVVSLRGNELTQVKLGDGRAVAVEEGAPPVQARLAAGSSTKGFVSGVKADLEGSPGLSLTMPGAAPLSLPGSRRVTVLATRQGEFIILDDPSLVDAAATRDGLHLVSSQTAGNGFALDPSPNHLPELLSPPPPASPVK